MKSVYTVFLRSFTLLIVLIASLGVHAQTIGPKRVLIRNVILFDPAGATEDKVVNILLRDNKLDIVTEDKLSRKDADMVVNAHQGVLLGNLEIGEKPSFLVFTEDPRSNFAVMKDTSSYSVFVVGKGIVVKNRLAGGRHRHQRPDQTHWRWTKRRWPAASGWYYLMRLGTQ